MILDDIINILKKERSFCLSGHENPDADVIGSQLAVANLIHRLDAQKTVEILNHGPLPSYLSFLPGFGTVKGVHRIEKTYDVVIVFECSGQDRMGRIINLNTQAKTIINIDHHLNNPRFGHINWVEPDTSSTSEMVFRLFEKLKFPLLPEEALCLYVGLVTDTGCFRYGNTNVQSHRVAADLIAAGVSVAAVSEKIYMSRSKAAMQLLTWALNHMEFTADDQIAILTLPEETVHRLEVQPDDMEELVNVGLLQKSVLISVLLKERANPPAVKVSFRSKGSADVQQIALRHGGGGHRNAAGCTIDGKTVNIRDPLLKELLTIL
ncbi:MAG: bifunctional oligoribonuclease/PAP phosphatase NrnA [Elusimicrobia bacterium]|nr:bifunctional oligoribonuclease/PAP phosphatase NrnA [Candidatus Obscuribacterium magneticum]